MVEAYILVQIEVGRSHSVAENIKDTPGIVTVELLTGPYDLIVRTHAADETLLRKTVLLAIQKQNYVTRTLTCMITN